MNTHPNYGTSFKLWRAAAPEAWRAYTRHRFVEGMRHGTLPQPAYLHYLVQDYVYLIHFSRAWALAVVKAETRAEMRTAAATVDKLINSELRLHVETCAAHGINEDALFNAVEEPENLAYTRYVLDAGFSGDFLDLMAALAPCVLGYGEIGMRLRDNAAADTPYQPWIDTYASEAYQTTCQTVGQMIDAAVERRLGATPQALPRWAMLCARFAKATELEAAFWGMGLRGQ